MSKNYILTGIGRERFPSINDYVDWIDRLSRSDIDFTVTDLGVAADINGFLEMIRPSYKLSPELGTYNRFGVVTVDGSYIPLYVQISSINCLANSGDSWSTEGSLEIIDPIGTGRAEFDWIPDSGVLKLKQISGDVIENPSSEFLGNLASISGIKDYLHLYGTL